MTAISYFQRYSARENHVTNNTLLMLRHLHEASPAKLEQVLREILGEDKIELGPSFTQQNRGPHSVPDAQIVQQAFELHIETKLGEALYPAQLKAHLEGLAQKTTAGGSMKILLGLSTAEMPGPDATEIAERAKSVGVTFKSVSFGALAEAVKGACQDHEVALRAVITDFVDFLDSEGLRYLPEDWMLVVPCGVSYVENQTFGVYYDGEDRPKRSPCRFLGIYRDKRISLVGEIKAVVVAGHDGGRMTFQAVERGVLADGMRERVRGIIEATTYYDLKARPHRFYVVDRFEETDLAKVSKGPVRGPQYLRLAGGPTGKGGAFSVDVLAAWLRGKVFRSATVESPESVAASE